MVNENLLFLDLELSKKNIFTFLAPQMGRLTEKPLTIEDYSIQLSTLDIDMIKLTALHKKLFIQMPLGFKINKIDGIFGLEGEGEMLLDLVMECNIDTNFYLTTKSELIDFTWTKEPKVHVGVLTLPAATIGDFLIKCIKEDLFINLDQKIAETFDLRSTILTQLAKVEPNIMVYSKPALYFNFELVSLQTTGFRDEDGRVHMHIWAEIASKISDETIVFEQTHDPSFHWIDDDIKATNQEVQLQLSYTGLSKVIKQSINGAELGGKSFDIDTVHIRSTSFLEIKANIFQPVKGIITITGKPVFDEQTQELNIQNLNIDINAENFIYKLSSPIIEKIVTNKVNSLLPLNIASLIKPYITKIPSISMFDNIIHLQPTFNQVIIQKFEWSPTHLTITAALQNAEVDVTL